MKQIRKSVPLICLALLTHVSISQTNWAGYDWFDGSAMMSLSDGNLVANMGTSSSTWTVYLAPENNPIRLENPGEKLVITWKFKLTGVNVSNTSQNFRIGIMDSPAETRVITDNAPVAGDYTGYALFGNMGQVTDNSGAFQIRERNATGNTLGTSSVWTAQDSGMGKSVLGYQDGFEYTFTATIERTENGSAQVNFSMVGGSINDTGSVSVSFLDGTPQPFVYDTFMIRPSNAVTTADVFTMTAFTVEAPASGPAKGPGYVGNYDIVPGTGSQEWVDTGSWIGWATCDSYPWVYMLGINGWSYIADPTMTGDKDASGAWFYILN